MPTTPHPALLDGRADSGPMSNYPQALSINMLYDDIQQIIPAQHTPRLTALAGVSGAVAPLPERRVRLGALRALF